jgi:hypothetical protein
MQIVFYKCNLVVADIDKTSQNSMLSRVLNVPNSASSHQVHAINFYFSIFQILIFYYKYLKTELQN